MLGEFEQIVLLAVLRVGDGAYGVAIADAIQRETRRDVTLASVYTTLVRLEEKGFVSSEVGEPTAARGGRRKRYYTVTTPGKRALRTALSALGRMARGLDLGWETP
jgi:PadR family transcriptional regulator